MTKKSYLGFTLAALILAVTASTFTLIAFAGDAGEAQSVTSEFEVTGMTCGGCEVGVKMAVKKLDGVSEVKASYDEGRAVVTYDPAKVTPADIVAAIDKIGYKAKLAEAEPAES